MGEKNRKKKRKKKRVIIGEDFEADAKISLTGISKEWMLQPMKVKAWGENHADAEEKKKKAKLRLEVTIARMEAKVRRNPDKYGCEKTTDTAVKSFVKTLPKVIAAEKRLIKAIKEEAIMASAKTAMEERRSSLKYLSELLIQGYFGKETFTVHREEIGDVITRMETRAKRKLVY